MAQDVELLCDQGGRAYVIQVLRRLLSALAKNRQLQRASIREHGSDITLLRSPSCHLA
jgi:hypothetical protein